MIKKIIKVMAISMLFLCENLVGEFIVVNFEGSVNSVGAGLSGSGVNLGDNVIGTFVYDTSIPDTNPDINRGSYLGQSFGLFIGDSFSASSVSTSISTQDDQQNGSATNPADGMTVLASNIISGPLNGRNADAFQFGLRKENLLGHLWLDDLLPDISDWGRITLADINAPDWHWIDFEDSPSDTDFSDSQIRWDVVSFNVVPEPSAFILSLLVLIGLAFIRKCYLS